MFWKNDGNEWTRLGYGSIAPLPGLVANRVPARARRLRRATARRCCAEGERVQDMRRHRRRAPIDVVFSPCLCGSEEMVRHEKPTSMGTVGLTSSRGRARTGTFSLYEP